MGAWVEARVEANALISLAKRGVRVIHRYALYMGACYTWNFMWVVIIVTGNTGRTGKNFQAVVLRSGNIFCPSSDPALS